MSELGNVFKKHRGSQSQRELSVAAGVALRTVARIEDGEAVKLATLRVVADYWKLGKTEWAALLVAWARCELGDEAIHVKVTSNHGGRAGADKSVEEFVNLYVALPSKYQRELNLAMQREEVLRSIIPVNQIYTKLQKRHVKGQDLALREA